MSDSKSKYSFRNDISKLTDRGRSVLLTVSKVKSLLTVDLPRLDKTYRILLGLLAVLLVVLLLSVLYVQHSQALAIISLYEVISDLQNNQDIILEQIRKMDEPVTLESPDSGSEDASDTKKKDSGKNTLKDVVLIVGCVTLFSFTTAVVWFIRKFYL